MGNRHSSAALAIVCLTGPAGSEEQSIMAGCQMSSYDRNSQFMYTSNAICDGGYKSMAYTSNSMVNGATYNKEVVVILSQSKKIVSSFVLNVSYSLGAQGRFGTSALYVGESSTPFSTSLTKVTADIFDGGFFKMNPPTTGKYVVLRRTGPGLSNQNHYTINEIRVYQTQNLLQERSGQVTISAPASTDPTQFPATNLITNLGNRSSGNNQRPLTNATGTVASYSSCYYTSNIQLSAQGNILIVSLNLGEPLFVHSTLVVQDMFTGWQGNSLTDPTKFLQNFEIYIGLNADHTLNPKCGGGPFMRANDPLSFVNVSYTGVPPTLPAYTGAMWKYGYEAWCNMEGQYLTIVADLTQYAGQAYLMSICQLGAFGTKYVRLTPVPSTLWILQGTTFTLNVENIAPDATLPIGNTLAIFLRQKLGTELAWVTITQGSPTVISFATGNTVALGAHVVSLQSYDNNGGVFSTLKQDDITVHVYPAECVQPLSQSSPFETLQLIVIIKEYSPVIYYPETLFTGPHTHTGFVCGGTYTQSIKMNAPVAGVVLTDQPTGSDLRPNIAISSSTPADSTFTLTFTGRYVHTPTSTDITSSFSQSFKIKTVFLTDYLDQPVITHSLTAAQLTFFVPPAETGNTPPSKTLAASNFTVAYPIKTGIADTLGNSPPAIAPAPYAGFSNTSIVKGLSSLGSPFLTSPLGSLQLQGGPGFTGDLNPGSTIVFSCDAWTSLVAKFTLAKTLTFTNSVESNFKASVQIKCAFGESFPPTFFKELDSIELVPSSPAQWALPPVSQGSFDLTKVKFEPDAAISGLLVFDEPTRTVYYRGSQSFGDLCGKQFGATVTLVNLIGQENRFSQALVFTACPVLDAALLSSKLAQSLIRQEPISLEKLDSVYRILPKTKTAFTFSFVDPLAQAIVQGRMPPESLLLSGINIKVISNTIPSAVQTTQITYERLGFGQIKLTADGNVAQELLDKQLAKEASELFLEGTVLVEVSDLSPEGKKSLFAINYLFLPMLDQLTTASHTAVETSAEHQPTLGDQSTASQTSVQTNAEQSPTMGDQSTASHVETNALERQQTVGEQSTASHTSVETNAEHSPTKGDLSTASDVETKAELIGEIIKKRLELLQETKPQTRQENPLSAKIEQVSKSGELLISFSNTMVIPDAYSLKTLSNRRHMAGDAGGTQERLASLFLELLNESKILSINFDRFDEGDSVKFQWRITSMTALTMEVLLLFDEPLSVSAGGLDRISATFNTHGLLYDRYGSEIKQGFTTNEKLVLKQFASKADAEFSKALVVIGKPIDIDDPPTKFILNTLLAAALQQILSAIPSSEIIVLIPYFDISMPAHVEALFNVLLQISAFEAIPTEFLFVDMQASLENISVDPKAERFEDLGFNGTWTLINLGSTFVIFGLVSAASLLLSCVPKRSERCPKLSQWAQKCRDPLKFGYPLQQFKESYVIIVTASLLNINFVSWSDAKDIPAAQTNLVLSYALLGFAAVYPAVQQWCLHRNRHKLNRSAFRLKYGATYENLRVEGTKFVFYPLFTYYRRLLLPIAIFYFDAGLITQLATLNLTGIATVALLFKQRPFVQGNTWELCEEFSLIVVSYHVLCLSQFVQTWATKYSIGTSLLACMALWLLAFLLVAMVAWFHTTRRNYFVWYAQRGVQRSIEARARARAQNENNRNSIQVQAQTQIGQLNEAVEQAIESSGASLGNSSSNSSSGSNDEESRAAHRAQSLSIIEEESSSLASQMYAQEESKSRSIAEEEKSSISSSQLMAQEECKSMSQDVASMASSNSYEVLEEEKKGAMDFMRQSYFDVKRANFEQRLINTINRVCQSQLESQPRSPVGVFAKVNMVRDSELHELGLKGVYDEVPSPRNRAPHHNIQSKRATQFELARREEDRFSREREVRERDLDPKVAHVVRTINPPKYRPMEALDSRVAPITEDPVPNHLQSRPPLANKQRFSTLTMDLKKSGQK